MITNPNIIGSGAEREFITTLNVGVRVLDVHTDSNGKRQLADDENSEYLTSVARLSVSLALGHVGHPIRSIDSVSGPTEELGAIVSEKYPDDNDDTLIHSVLEVVGESADNKEIEERTKFFESLSNRAKEIRNKTLRMIGWATVGTTITGLSGLFAAEKSSAPLWAIPTVLGICTIGSAIDEIRDIRELIINLCSQEVLSDLESAVREAEAVRAIGGTIVRAVSQKQVVEGADK